MKFNLDAIIGKNNNTEKRSEDLSEKKEKEEYAFNATESFSDYNKIKMVESRNSVHPENRYNSVEEEEKIMEPGDSFISAEDITDPDNNEDSIIERLDITNEKDFDEYGVFQLIERLIETAEKKNDKNELNNIIRRTNSFVTDYQGLLAKKLPLEQEAKEVAELFQVHLGKVAYVKGDVELVNLKDTLVKNARKNRRHNGEVYLNNNEESLPKKLSLKKKSEKQTENKSTSQTSARFKSGNNNKYSANKIERKIKINW